MELEPLIRLLDETRSPGGFLVTVALILLLVSGLVSKAAADYGGVFGAVARVIERRKKNVIAADEASTARRLDRLEQTIMALEQEISELRTRDSMHYRYQLYVAEYWRELQFWAVEHNVELPPPTLLAYPDWKKQQADAT
ncbi:hypothetical protein [Corynebacterium sp.]|uniref:hypothetical protein n=1 Tax=Corynebacterium sp. TaxID=1720 RepID=UPI002A9204A6|nr:hypothetical protein [Corynebacterium sp.]MDY5784675.1 hypothetical protein [Corynebacterium sp.]